MGKPTQRGERGPNRASGAHNPRPLLTVEQAAEWLGMSPAAIRSMVQRRQVPYFKVGRRVRFDPDHVQRWLNAQRVLPQEGDAA